MDVGVPGRLGDARYWSRSREVEKGLGVQEKARFGPGRITTEDASGDSTAVTRKGLGAQPQNFIVDSAGGPARPAQD